MNAVAPREKLARVLGLLGSEHSGEVVAAARAAETIRRRLGLQWGELLSESSATAVPERPASFHAAGRRPNPPNDWRARASWCLRRGADVLTPWERQFLAGLPDFPRLSDRQAEILDRIARKVLP